MAKKLTQRQQEFLSQFLDMYQEVDKPIHYVALADRLGLGKVTAYEMLRLLEKRGLVEAEYQLASKDRGPGRSMVLFRPTKKSIEILNKFSGDQAEAQSWEATKARIIKRLHEGKINGYEPLLNDLLARIGKRRSPLIFMAEMITATILAVASIHKASEDNGLLERLGKLGLPGEIGLSAMGGISSALYMIEGVHLNIAMFLLDQSGKFHQHFRQLNQENRERLSTFAREVTKIING
ncbi:MAG: hypothetical protein DWQ07_02775 [Chloroflexi bacterium]|nr:MAG: hypothetical protein DWQ07_02775 [Chloroflexota bacterium]MBL1193576.1 hypothetical protein [Chloroflexota bacterium]NOH10867.1 hypothetical protein [Chloroflexota bacterium]